MCDRLLASDRADMPLEHQHLPAHLGTRMHEILTRDQRTTCHRVTTKRHSQSPDANSDDVTTTARRGQGVSLRLGATRCCGDSCDRTTPEDNDNCCVRTYSTVAEGGDSLWRRCRRSCPLNFSTRTPKFSSSCSMWLRLGSLLVALLVVTVQSAPTMTLEDRRLSTPPKWMNPCGFASEEFEGDVDVMQLNDETLLGNIVMQAKTALNYALGFRDEYIKGTFNTDFADLHLTWKDNHYDWLPTLKQIPKQLGEQLEHEFLDKLEMRMLDTALLDAYEYMQRFAVGLEQVAWDQEDRSLVYRKQFKDTEYHLRSVLCELQMALVERNVNPRADISRDVMGSKYRSISDDTFRDLRDWLIFRDYMNGLEYIIEVFEHFVRGMTS